MRKSIIYIASNKILPLCGWDTVVANNSAFHAGLLAFSPFAILSSTEPNYTIRNKSPKDFKSTNPECNSGYIQMSWATLKGLNNE